MLISLSLAQCIETRSSRGVFHRPRLRVQERNRISRFRFRKDAKLALVGRLLLQHTACTALGLPFGAADFARTKENKPFLAHAKQCAPTTATSSGRVDLSTYNLNLSHHGAWAVVASDHRSLVGVDVMTTHMPRASEQAEAFLRDFEQCLTRNEWAAVRACAPQGDAALLRAFFVFWTLKEAYIKAVGIGLGLDLLRVEFRVPQPLLLGDHGERVCVLEAGRVEMRLDGEARPDWSFEVGTIDENHVLAVARGPLSDAVPSFRHQHAPQFSAFEDYGAQGRRQEGEDAEERAQWRHEPVAEAARDPVAAVANGRPRLATSSRTGCLWCGVEEAAEGRGNKALDGECRGGEGQMAVKVLTVQELLASSPELRDALPP